MWAFTAASLSYSWLGRWEQAVAAGLQGVRVGEEFADDSIIVLRLAHELLEDARLLLARMGARMVSNASPDTSRIEELQ